MATGDSSWTLGSVLPEAVARFGGDRKVLVTGGREFSLAELEALSNRVAGGLKSLGVAAGDRVTLYSGNAWQWIVAYYGIHKLGAVANPINVMFTPAEVGYVANDCGAKAVIASADKGAALAALRASTPIEQIILFGQSSDGERPTGTLPFDALLEAGSERFDAVAADPDALSTIGYTSGTTGHPKGAMLSHRAVLHSTAMTATMHMRGPEDAVVTALPCFHVYGNIVMNGAFRYGMKLVLLPRFAERDALAAIQQHRATMFEGVPTMFMLLLAWPERAAFDISSLRKCTVGGQTMPVAKMRDWEAWSGAPLLELWGMTELGGAATTHALYGLNRHGSIGVALPGTECRIAAVDDASVTMPPGEVGELMARGPLVMLGYYGKDDATKKAIEPDGWMRTGDLAKMDADGYVFIVDRKNDLILTGGYNVYPAEIERVVSAHPAVAMVAVGRKPDELKGEIAKAYVVLKPGASATEAEIVAFCREQLAAYKVPRAVQFVADLPKTSTGKVMRRELHTLDP